MDRDQTEKEGMRRIGDIRRKRKPSGPAGPQTRGAANLLRYRESGQPMNLTLAETAQLVAIVIGVVLVFWRGAAFKSQLTQEIRDSENRLRAENREAHAGITRNIDDVKQELREVKQDVRMVTQHLLSRAAPPDA